MIDDIPSIPEVGPRLLPSSKDAELGLLGSILIDPNEVMGLCVEKRIDATHFASPGNGIIFELIRELYDTNRLFDFIILTQILSDRKLLDKVGGPAFVTELYTFVPTSANAPRYIDILQEKRTLRSIITIGNDYATKAYEEQEHAQGFLDSFSSKLDEVAQTYSTASVFRIKDAVMTALEDIEKLYERRGQITGISTGFTDLDQMTDGLHPAEMIVIAARPSMGKAQPLSAIVITPNGPMQIGWVKEGDIISARDGRPQVVLGVFPQGRKKVLKVSLSDGSKTRCCAEHLWLTQTRNERRCGNRWSVKNTEEIKKTIHRPDGGKRNHCLPGYEAIEFAPWNKASLHPWLLGALIGDGKLASINPCFFKPEIDLQEKVKRLLPEEDTATEIDGGLRIKRKVRDNTISRTGQAIKDMGLDVLSANKFIPRNYLFGSIEDRWELLRGLIDTDGSVVGGIIEYSTSSARLAQDALFLIRSLGLIVSIQSRFPKYAYLGEQKTGAESYRLFIQYQTGDRLPFSSEKHHSRHKQSKRHEHRSIVSIEEDGEEECVCIKVSAKDQIYLTDDFIPTHNTAIAMNIAEHVAMDLGLPVGVFSLEMSSAQLVQRLLCSRAKVNLQNVRDGLLSDRDFHNLTMGASKMAESKLFIDDAAGLSILELRAKARKMKREHGIVLLVIDYLQLLKGSTKQAKDSRQLEISEISNGVKALAKELGIPILVLAQLNRNPEGRAGGLPRLSDLRESGSIEQDADLVGLLTRREYYETDQDAKQEVSGEATLIIAKQRNGPVGDVPLTFLKQFTRFENRARK